ncbi:hypothetical protein ABIA43_000949 [Bradyrhizobium sp. USDA 328]
MDTKERKAGIQTGPKDQPGARAGPDSGVRHTALAAKNDLESRKPISRGPARKKSEGRRPPGPRGSGADVQDLSASRAVSGASSVAMIVTIDSAMM